MATGIHASVVRASFRWGRPLTVCSFLLVSAVLAQNSTPSISTQQITPASKGATNTTSSSSDHQSTGKVQEQAGAPAQPSATEDPANTAAKKSDIDSLAADLAKQDKHTDFELSLGIGSLINNPAGSDYTNQSNTLASTNLGRASPQYLVGVSFRTPYPRLGGVNPEKLKECPAADKLTDLSPAKCQYWHQYPWKAFVNVKFTSGASQTINGFVIGGSYQFAHWVDGLIGFGLTPFNEASPGLKVAASQYVTAQQKQGNLLNFDPTAMLAGKRNAFDGFSLLDSTGKLIYSGTPLEVHYRGGVVIGIAVPISFKSSLASR